MNPKLLKDVLIISASIGVTILLLKFGAFEYLQHLSRDFQILNSFLAGMLFVSIFTAALGTAAIAELSHSSPLFLLAGFGALGALVTDYIIFLFVRNTLAKDLDKILRSMTQNSFWSRFRHRKFSWLSWFVGAIIIASPLPDEIGLTLMGLSKVNMKLFLPLSYCLNFIGIALIILITRSL